MGATRQARGLSLAAARAVCAAWAAEGGLHTLDRLLDGASGVVRSVPAQQRYRLADAATALVPFLAPGVRRRAEQNFARALQLPAGDPRARWLARASLRNFGRMAIDFLWVRTLANEAVNRSTELRGVEHLWTALDAGRGVVLVLPHLGCWDVAAAMASANGVAITIVTEDDWTARLAADSRKRPGITVVPRDRSLRPLLRALGHNQGVVLLSDLARPGLPTLEVPFFGGCAPLPSGPARLALRTEAPMVAVACVRVAPLRYRVHFLAPHWPAGRRDEPAAVQQLTAAMAADFEALIREYPAQWYPYGRIWSRAGAG